MEKAGAGHGQVVAVVGEPGVGKSRLFYEFTRSHRTEGWLILESGSASYGKATPYLPVIDLIKSYCQIQDRDDGRKIREKLTGKVLTLDRALQPTLPAFLALLDVPVDDSQWHALDPPQRRQRTLEAIKRLLLRESQVQPLLLVFEDLHWIDSETQALLDSLVESLPTARLLLLVNYRPEYRHGWGNKTYYSQLRIDPLPPASAEELLDSLLGDNIGLLPLKRVLIQRTEGNPFFLEESVRTLAETQVLAGERGSYRLTKTVESVQVPATVQAVLAARIDRLSSEEKRLLQSASVVGENVPLTLLQAVVEMPEDEFRRNLARLQAAEFLYETNLFPDLEYTFKHGLTYQVAYNSLLQDRRKALHARIVEAIETLYRNRAVEHVERLAHHSLRAEAWDKAVTFLHQAAIKAAGRSAHREAVTYFEQALETLRHLPQRRASLELAIDLRLELRPSLLTLGEHERIVGHLNQAETLARGLGDKRRLGRMFADMCAYFIREGEHQRAVNTGEEALVIARDLGDLGFQILAQDRLARVYALLGDYRRAIRLSEGSMALLEGKPVDERFGMTGVAAVVTRLPRATCLTELGELAEAIVWAEEAVRIAETVRDPFSLVAAYSHVSYPYLVRGDLEKAVPMLEHSLDICRSAHVAVFLSWVSAELGYAYLNLGRNTEALLMLEQAIKGRGAGITFGFHFSWLSEAYLQVGRWDDASEVGRRAVDRARQFKERGHEAWALRLIGEIAAQKDPPDVGKAEEHYRKAMALADELGMRPLVAHCQVGLGKLYRRSGDLQLAKEHLINGVAMMREMQMGLWLERAEAELKELE